MPPGYDGDRADRYLVSVLKDLTRSQLHARGHDLFVNGRPARWGQVLHAHDRLEAVIDDPPSSDLVPEEVDFDVVYEDSNIVVVDKPAGLVVHPAHGHSTGTLVHGLLHRYRDMHRAFDSDEVRPGIVHRLDKETSGVLIVAKNPGAHAQLAEQFRRRTTRKTYLAILSAVPHRSTGTVHDRLVRDPVHRKRFMTTHDRGREATTHYRVLAEAEQKCLAAFFPVTGRTHQIRVHAAALGAPIYGDTTYSRSSASRMHLHAYRLELVLPGETSRRVFIAPVPEDFLAPLAAAVDGDLSEILRQGRDSKLLQPPPLSGDRDSAE